MTMLYYYFCQAPIGQARAGNHTIFRQINEQWYHLVLLILIYYMNKIPHALERSALDSEEFTRNGTCKDKLIWSS